VHFVKLLERVLFDHELVFTSHKNPVSVFAIDFKSAAGVQPFVMAYSDPCTGLAVAVSELVF